MKFGLYHSAFGFTYIGVEHNSLTKLDFLELQGESVPNKTKLKLPGYEALVRQVLDAIASNKVDDVPIRLIGSPFQIKVWEYLRTIPAGKTATYKDIARAIGSPKAFRAVANACGANPMPIIVPCHRAIRSDGSLGGFALGSHMKRALLYRER